MPTYIRHKNTLIVSNSNTEIMMDMQKVKDELNVVHVFSLSDFNKVGKQLGSNTGGFYEDDNGNKFYMKFYDKEDIVKSEFKANAIYKKLGVNVPELAYVKDEEGTLGLASKVVDDLEIDSYRLKNDPVLRKEIMENFAIDCWMGLLDVVGQNFDNLLVKGDSVIRIDVGGSMWWRAQGTKKTPEQFGCEVPEIESMRDPERSAGRVFHTITNEEIKIGIDKILSLTDEELGDILGDKELTDIMICRKEWLRQYKNTL